MKSKILIVDDDTSHRQMLEAILAGKDYEIEHASDGVEAVAAVEKHFFDLILMDIRMKRMDGIEALKRIKQISPGIAIVIMTAYGAVDTAIDALKSGAYDYLTKPIDIDELRILVEKALDYRKLEQENRLLKEQISSRFESDHIIGKSRNMVALFDTISLVAPTEATVLILGESGTGKELIANAIHRNSLRKDNPFVKVNCAALPETLLESELFGHEKGAFTGADTPRKGRFQMAHTGTIFLDEIGDMAMATQAKILRVLQEKEIQPVGSSKTVKVDIRVIAATNKDLSGEVANGTFREDLYYRLNVVPIQVPSLRQRREDIVALADYFRLRFCEKNGKMIKGFTPRTMDMLMRYPWPGNVRELENTIERAVILARGDMITPMELPDPLVSAHELGTPKQMDFQSMGTLKDMEKQMILKVLEDVDGNRTRAAKILGISRRTLQHKLKEYGVN